MIFQANMTNWKQKTDIMNCLKKYQSGITQLKNRLEKEKDKQKFLFLAISSIFYPFFFDKSLVLWIYDFLLAKHSFSSLQPHLSILLFFPSPYNIHLGKMDKSLKKCMMLSSQTDQDIPSKGETLMQVMDLIKFKGTRSYSFALDAKWNWIPCASLQMSSL